MNISNEAKTVVEDCARQSQAETIDFGTVIARLAAAGIESYYADYRHGTTTYYSQEGGTHVTRLTPPEVVIADRFEAEGLHDAVRASQRGEIKYREFMGLSMESGCVSYFVWIAGRHVKYLGRRGEVHIEHFPRQ
ncbi:MAG: DUF1398 domain-containing protein [Pseudomonadota bacterium]